MSIRFWSEQVKWEKEKKEIDGLMNPLKGEGEEGNRSCRHRQVHPNIDSISERLQWVPAAAGSGRDDTVHPYINDIKAHYSRI